MPASGISARQILLIVAMLAGGLAADGNTAGAPVATMMLLLAWRMGVRNIKAEYMLSHHHV